MRFPRFVEGDNIRIADAFLVDVMLNACGETYDTLKQYAVTVDLEGIGQLLGLMSEGRPFTLIPEKQELTTVEAANFLNVSRPFVIKEIDAGRTPHRMVGSHRRILLTDLMEYAKQMQASREAALDELSQLRAKANDQRQAQTTNKSGPESEPRALGE